ncbi:unnamed protein product [Closterium sp. NIES-54]
MPCTYSHYLPPRTSRPAAARASHSATPHVTPCCSLHVVPCCHACRALLQPARRTLLPCASCPAAASASHPTATSASRPAALRVACRPAATTAAAARATAGGGGGAAGSAGSAASAEGAGGAAGAGGSGPTTDHHCLSWPLSRQLQRLGVDSGGYVEAAALRASESAAALGASESAAALGARASPPQVLPQLRPCTLDSGTSRCFFRDCTTLTPLAALVRVSLADPTGGPVVARASNALPCPAVPSGSVSGLHLPTFSTNLVSNAAIQDVWVDTFIPGGQHVAICTCSQTGSHLATFTRWPGSSLYTLTTAYSQVAEAGQVAVSSQVSASGQLAASCSLCTPISLSLAFPGPCPPSRARLPRRAFPASRGRQRAAPHSSEFPPTTAPLQTLHMDAWGKAPVGGTDHECYFLLVVDDYTRYTTVFPLRRKADVSGVLIPWIRVTRRQLRERFSRDFPVLRLHSNRGGEFSSDLLAEF